MKCELLNCFICIRGTPCLENRTWSQAPCLPTLPSSPFWQGHRYDSALRTGTFQLGRWTHPAPSSRALAGHDHESGPDLCADGADMIPSRIDALVILFFSQFSPSELADDAICCQSFVALERLYCPGCRRTKDAIDSDSQLTLHCPDRIAACPF